MDGSLPHPPGNRDHRRVVPGGQPGLIALSGELDAAAHETVRAALAAALNGAGARGEIVVDVRAVRFLDAGTVRLLLHAWRTANYAGRQLRITGAHGPVRHVIEASGAGHRLLDAADHDSAPAAGNTGLVAAGFNNLLRAATQRQRAEDDQTRILGGLQQQAIDREVRITRRLLLSDLRVRLRTDPQALSGEEFLAVADTEAVLDAILLAAAIVGAADACDLQLYDPDTATLHIIRQHGFTTEFLTYFATVGPGQPTACATAATVGEPVIIDDITHSPIFAGQPTLNVMLAAGSLAVQSHPLHHDAGQLLGVLSFHYRTTRPRRGNPELVAWCAARALTRMPKP